ncbi:hypothetical protein PENSTE_c029G01813 [Penicillium steckii]|uniref:Uncharacterized protein n=1 Tax=Penicillium steckii TaxID=303698 RepID=A0A1V6SNP7_9EURO|nr:hypothetical protein PENSTE_c029G01813 [Penicillium steckii]
MESTVRNVWGPLFHRQTSPSLADSSLTKQGQNGASR